MTEVSDRPDNVHQHSGWLIPLAILAAIAVLSALFLLYDLRPGMAPRGGSSTGNSAPVSLTVRGVHLVVPANYLDGRRARDGGEQDVLTLAALLPDMRGYSPAEARLFAGNAPDSPVVHLLFRGEENDLDAAGRLARIYRPYIVDPSGEPGDFGLTQYVFRDDSGYGREDLFAGNAGGRLLLFLCERADPELSSPNCLAIERPLAKTLSVSYRFKRTYLGRWREIAAGVDALLRRIRAR